MIIVRGRSFQQCFQSLTNCFGDLSPWWSTVCKWFKEFQQKDIWRQWLLWHSCDCCYWTKCGQGEVSDRRRSTNYGKWDERHFKSFIGKLESEPLSSPGCMEALRSLGSHQLTEERGGVGWSGAFICFGNLMEAGQSRSWTSSWIMRLLYPSTTWKPSSSPQPGFSQVKGHL